MLKEPGLTDAAMATGLFLWADLHLPKLNRGFLSRVVRDGQKQFVTWYHLAHLTPPGGKPPDVLRGVPAKDNRGQLRLVRTGADLYYYVAEGPSDEFALLQQHAFGTQDLEAIRWGGQTGGPKAAVEGDGFIDLRIQADGLPELVSAKKEAAMPVQGNVAPVQPADLPAQTAGHTGWLALTLGLGLAVLLLLFGVGLVVIALRRRQTA